MTKHTPQAAATDVSGGMQPPTELPPVPARALTPPAYDYAAIKPDKAPIVHAPLMRVQKMQFLVNQAVARGVSNQIGTSALLPLHGMDSSTWQELAMMNMAVLRRLQEQQYNWFQGLTEIVEDYSELRLANTLSKFIEQEYNIGAQIGALFTSQTANMAALMENIQVDYAYWIAQKQAGLIDNNQQG